MSQIVNLKPFLDILADAERNRAEFFAERDAADDEAEEQQDAWDRYLASRGLDGADDISSEGGTVSQVDREVDRLMVEFEALVERQLRDHDDAIEALGEIRRVLDSEASGRTIRDPHPDEPLSLFEAVFLPELGGQLFVGDEGIPGRITVKTLRGEIASGRLKRVPPLNKNIFVSRRTIKEWTEWRDDGSRPTSSGSSQNTTRPLASSGRTGTGRSQTARSDLARDSALSFVNGLMPSDSSTK